MKKVLDWIAGETRFTRGYLVGLMGVLVFTMLHRCDDNPYHHQLEQRVRDLERRVKLNEVGNKSHFRNLSEQYKRISELEDQRE